MLGVEDQSKANFISNLVYQPPQQRQEFLNNSQYKNDFFIDADANHKHHVSVHSHKGKKIYIYLTYNFA